MKRISVVCFVTFLLCACGANTPSAPSASAVGSAASVGSTPGQAVTFDTTDSGLPSWITSPDPMPPGRQGQNNCTFAFGQNGQVDFHPDGGCWEHAGPDHLTRQQLHDVHFPTLALCGGMPGDSSAIRVCTDPGTQTVCGLTGPNGCAVCVPHVTCH